MKHAAARESYEARLQISDYLCQILAQSMSLIGILRHEAQHIHSHSVFALRDNGKTDILAQFTLIFIRNHELGLIFVPFAALHLQFSLSHYLVLSIHQGHGKLLFLAIHAAGIETHIAGSTLHGDALPAYIINRCLAQDGIMRIVLAHTILRRNNRG